MQQDSSAQGVVYLFLLLLLETAVGAAGEVEDASVAVAVVVVVASSTDFDLVGLILENLLAASSASDSADGAAVAA